MFWILILSLLGVSITAAYRGFNLLNWTMGMALVLVGFAIFTSVSTAAIIVLSVLFAAIAIPLKLQTASAQVAQCTVSCGLSQNAAYTF